MEQPRTEDLDAVPDDPSLHRFWTWWLRLIFAVELLVAALLALVNAFGWAAILDEVRVRRGLYLIESGVARMVIERIILPIAFVVCAFACLAIKPFARMAMIIYCWCRLAWMLLGIAAILMDPVLSGWSFWSWLLHTSLFEMAVLLITLIMLSQKPVKQIFARTDHLTTAASDE